VIRGILLGGEPVRRAALLAAARPADIRAALRVLGTETAQQMAGEVDLTAEGVFESSKWTG
jgi:hypothetical protein